MKSNIPSPSSNLLPYKGEVYFHSDFYKKTESDVLFTRLLAEIDWKQEPIKLFGKEVMQPRLTSWYAEEGKSYAYSGIRMSGLNWTNTLFEIKQKVEMYTGYAFNSALLNYYRDGKDSMAWHRDNEKELGINPFIASLSFGATRILKFRNYQTKKDVLSCELNHGSLLLMQGETNHYWEHAIPKTKKVNSGRINITFRFIY